MTAVLEEPQVGNQTPKYCIAPKGENGFITDHAEDAIEFAAFYGLKADVWQADTCKTWMRQDSLTGKWLAGIWAITVSRQNGKNGTLEIVELYGMAELGLRFLHTAHEVKTARKAFIRLKQFFGEKANDPNAAFPELNALVKEVRNTNGQEAIVLRKRDPETGELTNEAGGSVEFIARSKGSGRGFTVDVLVLDEAQDLQDSELEALRPTISAAPGGDPVVIYMGTPPADIGLVGEPFVRTRHKAISGESNRTAWVEFGAEGEVDDMTPDELARFVMDPRNWADANPAWGTRVLGQTIKDDLEAFTPRSFARERLNMWPRSLGESAAIPMEPWKRLRIPEAHPDWPVLAYGIDMNKERTKVTISVAADHGGEGTPIHLELAVEAPFDDRGTEALVEWLWVRAKRRVPIVIDYYSPAKTIEPRLKKKKMKVFILNTAEFGQACGSLYDAVVKDKSITHAGQEQLDVSIKGTYREKLGEAGAFKWSRVSLDTDLGPIMAVTCAYFGSIKFARRKVANSTKKPFAAVY